jgi:hypothetical protein
MSYNLTGAITGGNVTLSKAGLALSGAGNTNYTTTAVGGASGIVAINQGAYQYVANVGATAAPTYDAASIGAVSGTANSGSIFRSLVAQQSPGGGISASYANSGCVFVFGLDRAGNVRVAQGRVVQITDTTTGSTPLPLPILPDWFTPFAYVTAKLVSATPASWVFGSGFWNATGLTLGTPVDIAVLPPTDPLSP